MKGNKSKCNLLSINLRMPVENVLLPFHATEKIIQPVTLMTPGLKIRRRISR